MESGIREQCQQRPPLCIGIAFPSDREVNNSVEVIRWIGSHAQSCVHLIRLEVCPSHAPFCDFGPIDKMEVESYTGRYSGMVCPPHVWLALRSPWLASKRSRGKIGKGSAGEVKTPTGTNSLSNKLRNRPKGWSLGRQLEMVYRRNTNVFPEMTLSESSDDDSGDEAPQHQLACTAPIAPNNDENLVLECRVELPPKTAEEKVKDERPPSRSEAQTERRGRKELSAADRKTGDDLERRPRPKEVGDCSSLTSEISHRQEKFSNKSAIPTCFALSEPPQSPIFVSRRAGCATRGYVSRIECTPCTRYAKSVNGSNWANAKTIADCCSSRSQTSGYSQSQVNGLGDTSARNNSTGMTKIGAIWLLYLIRTDGIIEYEGFTKHETFPVNSSQALVDHELSSRMYKDFALLLASFTLPMLQLIKIVHAIGSFRHLHSCRLCIRRLWRFAQFRVTTPLLSSIVAAVSRNQRSMYMKGQISGQELAILFDTGCTQTLLNSHAAARLGVNVVPSVTHSTAQLADGSALHVQGTVLFDLQLGAKLFKNMQASVAPLSSFDLFLGLDFMTRLAPFSIEMNDNGTGYVCTSSENKLPYGEASHTPIAAKVPETIVIPPRHACTLCLRVHTSAPVGSEMLLIPKPKTLAKVGLILVSGVVQIDIDAMQNKYCCVEVANPTNVPCQLYRNQSLAVVQPMDEMKLYSRQEIYTASYCKKCEISGHCGDMCERFPGCCRICSSRTHYKKSCPYRDKQYEHRQSNQARSQKIFAAPNNRRENNSLPTDFALHFRFSQGDVDSDDYEIQLKRSLVQAVDSACQNILRSQRKPQRPTIVLLRATNFTLVIW
ncbi:MAG: hypothetical protein GY820_40860 [Gammaproteobacteria bacterium]|nr:hypothetical protein [Gammaproteobacteria bacterium]